MYFIHVQIVGNVFQKVVLDVVFVQLHIMVMIVEKVKLDFKITKRKLWIELLFQFIDLIHAIIFIVVMDNVVKVFVNVMEVIPEHVVMLRVSIYFFLFKKQINYFKYYIIADLCSGIYCNYGTCYEGRCSCQEAYTGSYCDTPSMKKRFF